MIDLDKSWIKITKFFLCKDENEKVKWLNIYGWSKLEYILRCVYAESLITKDNYRDLVKICYYGFSCDYFLLQKSDNSKDYSNHYLNVQKLRFFLNFIELSLVQKMNYKK